MESDLKRKITSTFGTSILIIIFLAVWEILAKLQIIDIFFFSRPLFVLTDLYKIILTGEIFPHIAITLKETILGLLFGFVSGVAVAFIFGQFEWIANILDPIVDAIYGIPKLALGPLFILWFGLGIESKVFLAALMVFFLVFFNSYAGFKDVDPALINAVRLMGASRLQIITKVILPSCLPWIIAGLRAGIGIAFLGAIVGEYMGANSGLGWMIGYAGGMYDITRILSCIVILTVLIGIMNESLKCAEKHILKWRPNTQ